MWLPSVRNLARLLTPTLRPARPRARRKAAASRRPTLECLEDRSLPAVTTWTGLASGYWSNPGNWSTHMTPQSGDTVQFAATSPANVTIVDRPFTLSSLNIDAGWRGTISIAVSAAQGWAGAITLTGASQWAQSPGGPGTNGITGNGVLTNNGVLTLSGAGDKLMNLNAGTATLTNRGTILQTGTGMLRNSSPGAAGDVRTGAINNEAGGTYDLQSDAGVSGRFNNFSAATLEKTTGGNGTALVSGLAHKGGTIDVECGNLTLQQSTPNVVNTGAIFQVSAGLSLNLIEPSVGGGTYTGTYTGSGTGAVTFSGTLKIGAGNATFNLPTLQWLGGYLDVSAGNLINGSAGTITVASLSPSPFLTMSGGGALTNYGTLAVVGNGRISGDGALNNQPGASLGVVLNSLNAPISLTRAVSLNGSTLNADLAPEFTPNVGTVLTILSSTGGVGGTFTGLPDNAVLNVRGLAFRINYTPTAVTLTRVTPAATHFGVTAPASATAGAPFGVTVTALDASNNPVPSYTGTMHFTSTDPSATLPADYTFTAADNGVHVFTAGATLLTAGNQMLAAADTVTGSITGGAGVTVSPAALDHFTLGIVNSTTAGTAVDVTVTARDAYGNTVTGYAGTVHFSSSDAAAALPADYTFSAADAGTHTFAAGAALFTAGNQTLTAADGPITASAGVGINPAAAASFLLVASPQVTSGSPFDLTLVVQDAYGNTATGYTGTVTFTTSDADPGVTLPADYTFTAADGGVHVFTGGCTLVTPGPQWLTATDPFNALGGGLSLTVALG